MGTFPNNHFEVSNIFFDHFFSFCGQVSVQRLPGSQVIFSKCFQMSVILTSSKQKMDNLQVICMKISLACIKLLCLNFSPTFSLLENISGTIVQKRVQVPGCCFCTKARSLLSYPLIGNWIHTCYIKLPFPDSLFSLMRFHTKWWSEWRFSTSVLSS